MDVSTGPEDYCGGMTSRQRSASRWGLKVQEDHSEKLPGPHIA